jgi:hypothetical protein
MIDKQVSVEQQWTTVPVRQYASLLVDYLRPQKGSAALLAALLLGGIGLQLVNPQIVRYFLDAAETADSMNRLLGAAALFMGVALVRQVVRVAATYIGENVAWTATNLLRADLPGGLAPARRAAPDGPRHLVEGWLRGRRRHFGRASRPQPRGAVAMARRGRAREISKGGRPWLWSLNTFGGGTAWRAKPAGFPVDRGTRTGSAT